MTRRILHMRWPVDREVLLGKRRLPAPAFLPGDKQRRDERNVYRLAVVLTIMAILVWTVNW